MGPFVISLKQVQQEPVSLSGEMEASAFEFETRDTMIRVASPLKYAFEAAWTGKGLLVSGYLQMKLRCTCVRCLEEFDFLISLPSWQAYAELGGDEGVPFDGENIDLTPLIRDELVFALPWHPVCSETCTGMSELPKKEASSGFYPTASVWAALDQFRF